MKKLLATISLIAFLPTSVNALEEHLYTQNILQISTIICRNYTMKEFMDNETNRKATSRTSAVVKQAITPYLMAIQDHGTDEQKEMMWRDINYASWGCLYGKEANAFY